MDDDLFSIQIEPEFREKLAAMARVERRSLEEQAVYLVESGVRLLEGWGVTEPVGVCAG
ncbi:hypothetical protein AGMMS50267_09450 [Spirochaetia bacterium]|nr:hypothetical protein AGMMS50267_09450 [Spirochaetia bacterium]